MFFVILLDWQAIMVTSYGSSYGACGATFCVGREGV